LLLLLLTDPGPILNWKVKLEIRRPGDEIAAHLFDDEPEEEGNEENQNLHRWQSKFKWYEQVGEELERPLIRFEKRNLLEKRKRDEWRSCSKFEMTEAKGRIIKSIHDYL